MRDAKPYIEIGFMPKALSVKPEPYTSLFSGPADFKNYYLGWSYPPKDYAKWGELVYPMGEALSKRDTDVQRSKAGIGKFGMSRIFRTGMARRRSMTSFTTTRRQEQSGRFPQSA